MIRFFVAMSIDGYIADREGSEDFLSDEHWGIFARIAGDAGNVVMGRKTYERVRDWENSYGFDSLAVDDRVVLTKNTEYNPSVNYRIARSPQEAVDLLQQYPSVVVAGGSQVYAAFLNAGLCNEIVVSTEPVVLGGGTPWISGLANVLRLTPVATESYPGDIVVTTYRRTG